MGRGNVLRKHVTKFDKKRCLKCKYHAGCNTEVGGQYSRVICNYASINRSSCLKRGVNGSVVDSRGDDFYNCLLFEQGAAIKEIKQLHYGENNAARI